LRDFSILGSSEPPTTAPSQHGGRPSVDAAVKLAKGEAVEKAVWVPFELVTPGNINDYLKKN
jgi:ABC-type sugar transport system substrate-binding protein